MDGTDVRTKGQDAPHFFKMLRKFLKKECIDEFHPSYFVGFLGCGITANILYGFPFEAQWLRICGIIMFCLTILIFVSTNIMLVLSCWYYPERISLYMHKYNYSIYFAVHSMGYTTIVNAIHLFVQGRYPIFLWVLWWIGVGIATFNNTILFYFTFLSKLNIHTMSDINSTVLMHVVCCCVISSTGHIIAADLEGRNQQIITELLAFMLFCISIMLFHGVGAVYMMRLILLKVPDTSQIFTQFLPVGFTGQSSYSIMLFGNNMFHFIPDKVLGTSFLVPCALSAYLLLAGAYIYMIIAIISCMSKSRPFATNVNPEWTTKRFGLIKWSKGWWTMTFPVGTMSLANGEIAKGVGGYDFVFFKVMSAIFAVALVFICLVNLTGLTMSIAAKIKAAFFATPTDLQFSVKDKV
ncbi:uncharacterized protein LODBEIA_P37120 [Lodderomyces beijingensis]|uniref:Sulfite efflux pump SSU1 n=1 Tax=Lodderomyces beijingensis TaxID=1775926 RepID=A0ABP0ZMZ4_9ASCO